MPKPACDCKTPRYWVIAYLSSLDGDVMGIEVHCTTHKKNWWWTVEQPDPNKILQRYQTR